MGRICVRQNIKLCRRRHISQLIAASHKHNLTNLGKNSRFQADCHGNIGQRACGYKCNIADRCHQRIYYIQHRVFIFRFFPERCKYRSVKSCLSMYVIRNNLLIPYHGLSASCVHRNIQPQILGHIQRIGRCFLQRLVSGNHRDGQ